MASMTSPQPRFVRPLLLSAFCAIIFAAPQISPCAAEDLVAPTKTDQNVAKIVAALLERRHVSRTGLNDELSARAMELFLKSLDPMKLYFYQSDVDEFARYNLTIDDMVKGGNLDVAYVVFKRFLQRIDERVAVAEALLNEDFDFTTDESIVVDPDAARYPTSPEEAKDRWRRQIKFNLLVAKDEALERKRKAEESGEEYKPTQEDLEDPKAKLLRRYKRNQKRWHETDSDQLLELFLTSVTTSYDPHTTFMSPKSLDNFRIMMRLNLEGIGAALREKDGHTVVSRVIPGGAAHKQGELKADDYIVSVGQGTDGEMVDIVEMPLDDVVEQIRGHAGTIVRLGIKSGGTGETKILTITRAKVELEDSAARSQVVETDGETGPKMKIGYISLPSFYLDMEAARRNARDYRSSTKDVRDRLNEFKDDGIAAVILDLRMNGGGSLTEAINLTGLFIDQGPVVQVKDSDGQVTPYADEDSGVAWDGPLVVLTSKFSASASEILAGAIQDYGRGIVVGDVATHGKGTVQTLMDLGQEILRSNRAPNFGALKVTLQQFYLPDGESTQKEGVKADIILPSLTTHMDVGEADLEYALEHDRVEKTKHRKYNMMGADVLNTVRTNSANRIEKSDEFVDLLRRIESYQRQKSEKFVSLQEDKFFARRKELDSQKEEEKQLLEAEMPDDEVFRHNFYNDEVLNITRDYVEALKRQNLARAN
ncbi:Tail-specific protease precursor [Rosistilla oblonga]|uniref:Tail-specific protease n=2 Tax=Rosistilla oblonga TaxID=2527990 RepID=A0A518IN97_9BACT|nr:Tail-specific protease precursor [Rosistilla oblonga]